MPFSNDELATHLGLTPSVLSAQIDPYNGDNYSPDIAAKVRDLQRRGPEDFAAQEKARAEGSSLYSPPGGVGPIDMLLSAGTGRVPLPSPAPALAGGGGVGGGVPMSAAPVPTLAGPRPYLDARDHNQNANLGLVPSAGMPKLGTPAPPAPPPIRALRMPNGKIIWTNRVEGEKGTPTGAAVPRLDALAEIRGGEDTVSPLPMSQRSPLDRASAMFGVDGGGSMMSADNNTTEYARNIHSDMALEETGREAALAQNLAHKRDLMMTPEQKAQVTNPSIVFGQWAMKNGLPQLQAMQNDAMQKAEAYQTPGTPNFIPDPRMRARKMAEDAQAIEDFKFILSLSRGVPPSTAFGQ